MIPMSLCLMGFNNKRKGRLSWPSVPLKVGLDDGYVHAREGNSRKAGWFEK
jgi:hypothetical protein